MLRLEHLLLAIMGDISDFAVAEELSAALKTIDLVGFEQRGDTAGELFDDAGFTLLHGADVHRHLAGTDAMDRELLSRPVVELGTLEQGLGGNTAGVETGAAERGAAIVVLPFVDAGGLQSMLAGADRGHVAGRTGADDDDVVLLTHFIHLLEMAAAGMAAGRR